MDGYPIEFSMWNIQVKDGRVTAMNGDILANPNGSTEFTISQERALEIALEYTGAKLYMWESEKEEQLFKKIKKDTSATYYPQVEKVIVPDKIKFSESKLRAAYKFDIFALKPHSRKAVYVDAHTGEVLFDLPLMYNTSVQATAHTQYSGVQQITTEYNGSYYTLRDSTRGKGIITMNANDDYNYYYAMDFTNNDTVWNNVNAALDQYATDAHFATTKTYDYYFNIHNRNSIDGYGHNLISYVHFDLIGYGYGNNVNAFWNGYCMTYGDGDANRGITPLTTIDICAHEITHGLTQHTANLVYQDESGALNEAFSDIFGAAVEFYAVPNLADWTMGEKIGYTMRSLQSPKSYGNPDTYQGTYWVTDGSDNGGVHTNSGPMYYWFYLLCQGGSGTNDLSNSYNVTAIGIEKAEQIAFKLLTQYLTSTSEYVDAWFYGLQAAADIYGSCSEEVKAVGDAFYAIGVADAPYVNVAFANFSSVNNQSCFAPFYVNFTNSSYNSDSYFWDFGDGHTSTQRDPRHIYTQSGIYNVKLTVNSSNCGTDSIMKIDYIVIDEELECITIMPVNDSITIEGCGGLIYDTGGPDGNYYDNNTSVLTIYSPGASSIVLNILEFNIEEDYYYGGCNDYIAFYDGSSTASTLIDGVVHCNYWGNPGTITSSGEYITILFYTDMSSNLSGFKIEYYCINNSVAPTPLFSADKNFSCEGWIQFTDGSVNNPVSWLWDFGDGTTGTDQNPNHLYMENGSYHVKLTTTNAFGSKSLFKKDYITIGMPEAPKKDSVIVCNNANFDINLDFSGIAYWYNDISDQTPVYTGNTWNHPPVSQNTSYYVRESFEEKEYNVGPKIKTYEGDYMHNSYSPYYLVFDAYEPFILKSVSVEARWGDYKIIALRNSAGDILSQKMVYISIYDPRVELNMEIPQGSNLQLACLDYEPYLFYSYNTPKINYPYTINDIVSIKNSSAGNRYYFYFYDWEISTIPCMSQFTDVTLIPQTCNTITNIEEMNTVYIAPNPNNGFFEIIGLEDMYPCTIEITDVSSKKVYSNENFTGKTINLTHCASGLYFLKISNSKGQKVIKFAIQK